MSNSNLGFVVFLILIFGIGSWERKVLRRLPDEERLKVMACQKKTAIWAYLPLAILAAGFWGFHLQRLESPLPASAIFIVLVVASHFGYRYFLERKLAATDISPDYLKIRHITATVSGILMTVYCSYLLWSVHKA